MGGVFDAKDFSQRMNLKGINGSTQGNIEGLGTQGLTINYETSL